MTPNVLTIAGTDPSGAAGIQVDLAVFRDFGVHGLSAITAVVAQNTSEVLSFEPQSPDSLSAQLEALSIDGIQIGAIKVGMLPTIELIQVVIQWTAKHPQIPLVVDTVLASGSGQVALAHDTVAGLKALVRTATVVTPNIPEAFALVGELPHLDLAAATKILTRGDVLLKGGHTPDSQTITDIWCDKDGPVFLAPLPRIAVDVRGTGCQLSSAIAAGLALGLPARDAAEQARTYLGNLLHTRATRIGNGRPIIVRTKL